MAEEKKRTILCVDDEPDVVSALYDTFMDFYEVKTATSGEEALNIFNETDISLVISDQRMPEMEGTELLAAIHKIKPICKKILLTGYSDINVAIDAINLGAVDKYFSKPWEDDELIKSVKDLLKELDLDEFFENAIEDAKGMKKEIDKVKGNVALFEKFIDNYAAGVCIMGLDKKIQYINKRGVTLLKYNEAGECVGKAYRDIFLIADSDEKRLMEKNMKKDVSPDGLNIKLCDGSSKSFQSNVIFSSEENGIQVSGIVFYK